MRPRALLMAVAVVSALMPTAAVAQDHVIDEPAEPSFLSVVSAIGGIFVEDTLILEGVPAVLYFSDRPARIAGHMSVGDFVTGWDADDGFAADPPNAALSVLGGDVAVLELVDVRRDGDTMTFDVRVIDGMVPEAFGPASLFIDDTFKEKRQLF